MEQKPEILNAIDAAAAPAQAPAAVNAVAGNPQPAPQRKKPGRPRKTVNNIQVEVHGVSDKPANVGDTVELVYCQPNTFKKILTILKQYEVPEVELRFEAGGMRIVTKDHLGKSTIHVILDGKRMNLYYCKDKIRVCVKREDFERVIGSITKEHYKITFILNETYRSYLHIVLRDGKYNINETFDIEVVHKDQPLTADDADDDANYPIKFVMDSKTLKTKLTSLRKLSTVWTIQKVGLEPLQFTYDGAKKINYNGVCGDAEKIKLESTVKQDETFTVSVLIDYIKPFTSASIGEDIYVAADMYEKLSLMTFLDKKDDGYACCVKVFTEIKDYRKIRKPA